MQFRGKGTKTWIRVVILGMEGAGWSEWALDLIPNWQGCWNPLTSGIVRSLVEISYSGWGSGTFWFGKRWWFCSWTGLRLCLWRCPIGSWKCRTKRGESIWSSAIDLEIIYIKVIITDENDEILRKGAGAAKREEGCVPWYLEEETIQQKCHREE